MLFLTELSTKPEKQKVTGNRGYQGDVNGLVLPKGPEYGDKNERRKIQDQIFFLFVCYKCQVKLLYLALPTCVLNYEAKGILHCPQPCKLALTVVAQRQCGHGISRAEALQDIICWDLRTDGV